MMFSAKELKLVFGLTAVLLAIGIASYAAFPPKPPKQPVRIAFQTVAGKAMFDHAGHSAESGFGLKCGECHHTLSEEEYDDATSCSECHDPQEGDKDMPKRSDALHLQCIGCHQQYGAGPVECAQCHVMF